MIEPKHPTLPSGTQISDKYVVGELLGVGGMGAVYNGSHLEIGRKCAVKVLHKHLASSPTAVERFRQEARAAAGIGHDNICEVTDFGCLQNGTPFFVMPLLMGDSLADVISEAVMEAARVVDIVNQTLAALGAAHNARIVHRDLKPENIFVIEQLGDRRDFVKLLDFGISKFMDPKAASNLTDTGVLMGTPYYMAPEQLKGDQHFDHRVDLYAVGVILYQSLTGKRPFGGESFNEVMYNILTAPYTAPSVVNPELSGQMEDVIIRAMSRDPADRYTSAAEMLTALNHAFQSEPTPSLRVTGAQTLIGDDKPFTPTIVDLEPQPVVASNTTTRRNRSNVLWLGLAVFLSLMALIVALFGAFKETAPSGYPPVDNTQPASPDIATSPDVVTPSQVAPTQTPPPKAMIEPIQEKPQESTDTAVKPPPKVRQRRARQEPPKIKMDGPDGATFFTEY